MSGKRRIAGMMISGLFAIGILYALSVLRILSDQGDLTAVKGCYEPLPADISTEEPLAHMGEDFLVDTGFSSNLPIVILKFYGEITEYKSFQNGQETVAEGVEPYTDGNIQIIDNGAPELLNHITDSPVYSSNMKIKKRGHTSFSYDKPQYLMKMMDENKMEYKTEILGMGEGYDWILNGSMADKSMIRNYIPYRIASEVGGGAFSPDCRFCEVLLETEKGMEYCGVYLLTETVERGESRVNIDKSKEGSQYSSYIVRRDRFTNYDVMLATYGRLSGLSQEWIGLQYPASSKLSEKQKAYIEEDFSHIERVLYSEEEEVFRTYDRYIDMDSFVDYFLVNEFFGNYDAGNHSTYMYKASGGKLQIGPVWDFDQAMNNYFAEEMDASVMAFQSKPLFESLCRDKRFIDALKGRYSELRKGALAEEHIVEMIEETKNYLTSAREREWYRWEADYAEGDFRNPHNYYLEDYVVDDVVISRFNDDYEQELYNIRNYLHKHGRAMQTELSKLYDLCKWNTGLQNERELFLLMIMILFLLPSVMINRKG